jgi:phosphoglycolate phosphatase-like HAD superfamily hydrolase
MDNPRMPKTTIPNTTIPKTTIHGILFDKDGTLFDFQATWKRVIEAVLDTLAPDRDTWSRMARAGGYHPVRGSFLPGSPVVAGTTSQIAQLWSGFRPTCRGCSPGCAPAVTRWASRPTIPNRARGSNWAPSARTPPSTSSPVTTAATA